MASRARLISLGALDITNIAAQVVVTTDVANGAITEEKLNNVTTNVIIEGSNLYFTNDRVYANVEQMSVDVFVDVDIANVQANDLLQWNGTSFVPTAIANVAASLQNLDAFTTSNLAEGSNLYFTNARAVGALTAGQNIDIQSNGLISANVGGAVSLVINTDSFSGNGVQTVFALSSNVTNNNTAMVMINGLVQIPVTDYTASNNELTFTSAPIANSNIEVRSWVFTAG